jgi:hypothetical protein
VGTVYTTARGSTTVQPSGTHPEWTVTKEPTLVALQCLAGVVPVCTTLAVPHLRARRSPCGNPKATQTRQVDRRWSEGRACGQMLPRRWALQ